MTGLQTCPRPVLAAIGSAEEANCRRLEMFTDLDFPDSCGPSCRNSGDPGLLTGDPGQGSKPICNGDQLDQNQDEDNGETPSMLDRMQIAGSKVELVGGFTYCWSNVEANDNSEHQVQRRLTIVLYCMNRPN